MSNEIEDADPEVDRTTGQALKDMQQVTGYVPEQETQEIDTNKLNNVRSTNKWLTPQKGYETAQGEKSQVTKQSESTGCHCFGS
jgi:hypothetical protein